MNYKDFYKEVCGLKPKASFKGVDPKERSLGDSEEKEHTTDPDIADTVASHHLKADKKYYSKLKDAGLADELKKENIGITPSCPCNTQPDNMSQMTVGVVGGSSCDTDIKTDVEKSATDPTSTDHITGGMNKTPENPNILSKDGQQPVNNSEFATFDSLKSIGNEVIPKDISIDIAESKKILSKMMKETLTSYEKDVEKDKKTVKKEGYGGDPSTDDAYVKGKRWTVKWNK